MGNKGNNQPQRKKKTNAEITNQRKADMKNGGQKHAIPNTKNKLCWNDVSIVHQAAVHLISTPAMVAPFLRDSELMSKIANQAELKRLSGILVKDVQQYNEQLNQLKSQWEGRTGNADSPEDLIDAITIAQSYESWSDSFTTVVIPNVAAIIDMVNTVLPEDQRVIF